MYCVTLSPMSVIDEDHHRLVINCISSSAFCDSSLWLEKWLWFSVT